MFASSAFEEMFHYMYYQLTDITMTMLEDVNGIALDLFSNDFIVAILHFFEMFAWGLGLTGAAIAMMEFAVTYQTGGGGSFLGTGMNMLRLFIALLTFSSVPVAAFSFSMDMYSIVREAAVGSMSGTDISISTLATGALGCLFKSVYGTMPTYQITGTIWNFLSNLQDGFQMTDAADAQLQTNADWWALIQLIILVYVIFKVFMGNLKRGGILVIQISVGSLHMYHLARGYTDGFSSWCKQVAALCFTAFLQNILYLLGLILMQDAELSNIYLALIILLSAAEVPRIAQMLGLDTSSRHGISSAVHSATSVISLVRHVAK